MQSRLPCGWILRRNVWWKNSLMLQNNLIYQHVKKSILEFIIRNPLCHSNPLLFNYSVSALSPGWSVTFPMESHLQADSPTPTWIGSRKDFHCWNSWPCMQRALSALAEQGFTAIMASFKSGWALILFLQPNKWQKQPLNESLRSNSWAMVSTKKEYRLCIYPFRKPMTKEC